MSYRPLAHLSAGALDGVGTSEGGRRKLWGLGRVDVVLVTKCIASFFGEAATLASSTYALRLAARVPGANRARTYGVLLSLFDAGGACGAALSAALARHVVYGVWEHVGLEEHKVVTFLHEPERGLELGPLHDLNQCIRHALHLAGRLDAARLRPVWKSASVSGAPIILH